MRNSNRLLLSFRESDLTHEPDSILYRNFMLPSAAQVQLDLIG